LKSAWLRQHLDPNSLEKVLADVQEWMKAHFDICLAIPCGSVSVERLFNGGKDMTGLRRYSLRGETFRILMLLNSRSHSS